MKEGTETFKKTIQQYLEKRASEDTLFAETIKKENKNIDECVNYILSEVQKSGCNGFVDDEIFGMAVHYYDEDDVKLGSTKSMKVVVNHHVELTDEEKVIAKEKAMKLAIEDAKEKAMKKLVENIKLSVDEIESAKQQAIEKVVSEQKEKLSKNKSIKKVEISNYVEQNLFS